MMSIKKKIRDKLASLYYRTLFKIEDKISRKRERRVLRKNMRRMDSMSNPYVKQYGIKPLSTEEKSAIRKFWAAYVDTQDSCRYYSVVKEVVYQGQCQIDLLQQYVSTAMMNCCITPKLNKESNVSLLENKSLYTRIFGHFNQPYEVLCNINGIYYDSSHCNCTRAEAERILLNYGNPVIVKSSGSFGGRSVRLLQNYDKEQVESMLEDYGKDFVVQAVVKQSAQMASFNASSLNTFRITTLLLDGRCTVISRGMRHGLDGSVVDNADQGGRYIGVTPDGFLKFAINTKGEKNYYAPDGRRYSDIQIVGFQKIQDFAVQLHYSIPICSVVGWDIALDENDDPIFIEANSKCPGVTIEQIADEEPIFGDRLEEVLNYLKSI